MIMCMCVCVGGGGVVIIIMIERYAIYNVILLIHCYMCSQCFFLNERSLIMLFC